MNSIEQATGLQFGIGKRRSMRFLAMGAACALASWQPVPAQVENLYSALGKTLENSPTLAARRAELAARSESIVLARRDGRPTVTGFLGATENLQYQLPSVFNPERRGRADLALDVPLMMGGRVRNAVEAAASTYQSDWAQERVAITELLLEAVMAYANVLRDEAVVELSQSQIDNLELNLRMAEARFTIGDLSRTDVAQSTARLALARAEQSEAVSNLRQSQEEYLAIVGVPATDLEPPEFDVAIPVDERQAIETALMHNDALDAVRHRVRAADYRIAAARSERRPKIYGTTSVRYFNYFDSITTDLPFQPRFEGTAVDVGLTVEIPLYQGGSPAAKVRRANSEKYSSLEEATAIERAVVGRVRTARARLDSLALEAVQAAIAIEANEQALRGARVEHEMGMRTLLDVLDAESELLEAQKFALSVERDRTIAKFALAVALGSASPEALGPARPGDPRFSAPPTPRASWSDWADGDASMAIRY